MAADDGHPAILVDGVVQSVAVEAAERGYWAALVPEVRPRAALVLGLGAGTVAALLARRFGPLSTVGVDNDADMVTHGPDALGLELG